MAEKLAIPVIVLFLVAVLVVAAIMDAPSTQEYASPVTRLPRQEIPIETPARPIVEGSSSPASAEGEILVPPIRGDDGGVVSGRVERALIISSAERLNLEAWGPGEDAFLEHVSLRVRQIQDLDLAYVRDLFGADAPLLYAPAISGEGVLSAVLEIPSEADARALYKLRAHMWAFVSEQWNIAGEADEAGLHELADIFDDAGNAAWSTLFEETEVAYPHWPFLMRLADLHFN